MFYLWLFLLIGNFSAAQNVGFLGPHGRYGNRLAHADHWIALVGDSGLTGAASNAQLEAKVEKMWAHFGGVFSEARVRGTVPKLHDFPNPERFGMTSIEPLTRVAYSRAEYNDAGWIGGFFMNFGAKLALKLDTSEFSFGYMVGRALGIESSDIVLVGQDGVKVETIGAQFARIFEMSTTTLPPLILISFTANNLCDEKIMVQSVEQWSNRFKVELEQAWLQARPNLIAHPRGTQIVVVAPLDVVNVITNPDLLAQAVNVEGQGQITCGQLRHGSAHFTLGSWLVLRMLNLMCPSVTQTHPQDNFRLERLRAMQAAFIEIWKSQLLDLNNQYKSSGIRWDFLEDVRNVSFVSGDLANDCFHPSVRGHARVAEVVLSHPVLRSWRERPK